MSPLTRKISSWWELSSPLSRKSPLALPPSYPFEFLETQETKPRRNVSSCDSSSFGQNPLPHSSSFTFTYALFIRASLISSPRVRHLGLNHCTPVKPTCILDEW